jgi:transposase
MHAFNEQGFAALDPKWSGGRRRKFGPQTRETIARVAKTAPPQLGLPFTTWSLTKLVEHLGVRERISVSTETVRTVLRDAGISWQATKTWKASRDPDFTVKKDRILELYDQAAAGELPEGARVICVDEFGPLNLQPRPGHGWFPRGRPTRRRATYTRTGGVRHMIAALDLVSGQMFYRFRDRKRSPEFLGSCANSGSGSPPAGCTWSATTSHRIAPTRSPPGAPPTTSSWSSPRPTPPG